MSTLWYVKRCPLPDSLGHFLVSGVYHRQKAELSVHALSPKHVLSDLDVPKQTANRVGARWSTP